MVLRRRGAHDLKPSRRLEELAEQLFATADEVSLLAKQLQAKERDEDEQPRPRP
jgi:hypothetical protein